MGIVKELGKYFLLAYKKYQLYFAGGGFGFLLALSSVWLLSRRKADRNGWKRELLGGTWAVLVVCALFPVIAWQIMKWTEIGIYWRIFWTLPMVVILAYTCVELTDAVGDGSLGGSRAAGKARADERGAADGGAGTAESIAMSEGAAADGAKTSAGNRRRRVITVLGLIALFALNGTWVFSSDNFAERGNNYKLPQQVIEAADIINNYAAENNITVKRVVGPDRVAINIRMYDASILQVYGRNMTRNYTKRDALYYQVNAEDHDYEILCRQAKKNGANFVILDRSTIIEGEMELRGYQEIGWDLDYMVFYCADVDVSKYESVPK